MGDEIEIKAIEFIDSINMYQVDLYNVTKGEYYRVFIPKEDIEQAKDDAFETKTLDEEMRKFTDMVAKHLADGFDSPCNYSPLDEEMFDYCGGIEGECNCDDAVECWKRVFKMWQEEDEVDEK